jgi:D-alanyl-lipoteichoic acid acyltransferase DltB (MBOAT superfamily)
MWWANFKLVAFCCGRGPLSGKRSPTVWAFASVLLLPMSPISESEKKRRLSARGKSEPATSQFKTYVTKGTLKVVGLAICVWILKHLMEHQYGNWTKNLVFAFALYYLLGVFEDLLGSVSANLIGIEVERSFKKPFLSTSLKEFWTLRWNQHVAKLLKVVVYEPIVEGSLIHKADSSSKSEKKSKGRRPMPLHVRILGTLGTFAMSGIMHEIVFMFVSDTLALSWLVYFTLQGVYVLVEGILVHLLLARTKTKGLPKWLSIPLTLSFLLATGDWHFFEPLRVHGVDAAVLDNVASIMNAIVNIHIL